MRTPLAIVLAALTLLTICARRAAAASFAMVDPVPELLNGPAITTDPNALATGGTAVQGVAAEGVAEIVLRVAASAADESFTFTVINDQNQPSTSINDDGAIGAAGSPTIDQSSINLASVSTSTGPMAFAIYRAPLDFARAGGGDDSLTQRAITIQWTASNSADNGSTQVAIIRPLVVLVHGLWGEPSDWNDFGPLYSAAGSDPRFAVRTADYSFDIGESLASTTPSYDIVGGAKANSLGFAYNAGQVAQQIDSLVAAFKAGANPAGIAVAAVQADVVGHSMGGDVTRTMPLLENFASATTLGQGNVHKLVTVDTPHLGSPLALALLANANECARDTLATDDLYSFESVTVNQLNISISGAMGDLSGDGAGGALSYALAALQSGSNVPIFTPQIPTAYIAGVMSQTQLNDLTTNPTLTEEFLTSWCSEDPLAQDLTPQKWPTLLSNQSDAIVPYTSHVNNASPAATPAAAVHGGGAETLGFGAPDALNSVTGNPDAVINLLNTPITDPVWTVLR